MIIVKHALNKYHKVVNLASFFRITDTGTVDLNLYDRHVSLMDKMNSGPAELVPFELLHLELGNKWKKNLSEFQKYRYPLRSRSASIVKREFVRKKKLTYNDDIMCIDFCRTQRIC